MKPGKIKIDKVVIDWNTLTPEAYLHRLIGWAKLGGKKQIDQHLKEPILKDFKFGIIHLPPDTFEFQYTYINEKGERIRGMEDLSPWYDDWLEVTKNKVIDMTIKLF